MPTPQVKGRVLDINLSEEEMKLVEWAADLEVLKVRVYARRVVLLAARERLRIESGLDGARARPPTKS